LEETIAAAVYKTEIPAGGIRHANYATPLYPQKLGLTSPTSGGRSVSIVRLRTKATELFVNRTVRTEGENRRSLKYNSLVSQSDDYDLKSLESSRNPGRLRGGGRR
jgi:hypothetical protein